MIESDLFNRSAVPGTVDNCQTSFVIDNSKGAKANKADILENFRKAVNFFHVSLKDSIDAEPMKRDDFQGMTQGDSISYHEIKLVGLPYYIGVLTYSAGTLVHYKLGLKVQKFKL